MLIAHLSCLDCDWQHAPKFEDHHIKAVVQKYSTCGCGSKRIVLEKEGKYKEIAPKQIRRYSGTRPKIIDIFDSHDFDDIFAMLPKKEQNIILMRRVGKLSFGKAGSEMGISDDEAYRLYKKGVCRMYRIQANGSYYD